MLHVLLLHLLCFRLPAPSVPPLELMFNTNLLIASFTIALVAYCISFAMAKLFANMDNYEVQAGQELLAQVMQRLNLDSTN